MSVSRAIHHLGLSLYRDRLNIKRISIRTAYRWLRAYDVGRIKSLWVARQIKKSGIYHAASGWKLIR